MNGDLTVGVLGGLGPEATLDFFARVLRRTRAASDQQHLRLLIDNNPKVPNRNEAVAGRGPSPGPLLAEMARGLERAGADFLVMPCNAAHAFRADIEAATPLPLVSIIEETVRATLEQLEVTASAKPKIGVLASSGCLDAGLYPQAFAPHGITVLAPEGGARERFMTLLYRIKSGDKGVAVRAEMRALAAGLVEQGAQAIVAGCTEVPLVLFEGDLPCPLVDSTEVLAQSTVAYARGERALPARAGGR